MFGNQLPDQYVPVAAERTQDKYIVAILRQLDAEANSVNSALLTEVSVTGSARLTRLEVERQGAELAQRRGLDTECLAGV